MPGGLGPGRVTRDSARLQLRGQLQLAGGLGGALAARGSLTRVWSLSQPPAPAHGGHQEDKRTRRRTHPLSTSGSRHGHAVTVQHTDTW